MAPAVPEHTPARLTVLSGPSGVGKSTVVAEVRRRHPDVWVSVSATTRRRRPGEVDGVHYHFVSDAEFDRLIAEGGDEIIVVASGPPTAMIVRQKRQLLGFFWINGAAALRSATMNSAAPASAPANSSRLSRPTRPRPTVMASAYAPSVRDSSNVPT